MTCENGTQCRREVKEELVTKLRNDWVTILKNFNKAVHDQLNISENDIVTAYGELVRCEQDAECCPYDDSVVITHLEKITAAKRRIRTLELEIKTYEVKIDEIEHECPDEYAMLLRGEDPADPTNVVSTDGLTASY